MIVKDHLQVPVANPHEFISRYKLVASDLSKLLCSLWLSLRNAYRILVVQSEDVRLLGVCEDVIKMDLVAKVQRELCSSGSGEDPVTFSCDHIRIFGFHKM